jgi:nucleotide-binding universal stress UspA family protein
MSSTADRTGRPSGSGPSALGRSRLATHARHMVATTERQPTIPAVRPLPAAADAGPPPVQRIVVPVDGSPFAERALPIAAWIARSVVAPMHLVQIVDVDAPAEAAMHHLDELAHRHGAEGWNVARAVDTGDAIVAAGALGPPGLVCMATHGRDRSAVALGSVAMRVLDGSPRPVMLVGPAARPPCADDAPVVVAADGGPGDETVVRVAAAWAAGLGRSLVVATVAEPVPPSFRPGRPPQRARGPAAPEAHVASLAATVARGRGDLRVDTRVVYDPVSVRDGMLRLVDRTAALLVLGTHHRSRTARAVVGSHAARLVHDAEVPALVVPLASGD